MQLFLFYQEKGVQIVVKQNKGVLPFDKNEGGINL